MDARWLIPKLIFILSILSVIVFLAYEAVQRARGETPRGPLNYSLLTFFLLGMWLTSEGLEIVLSRMKDPVVELQKGLREEIHQHMGGTQGRHDRKEIFDGLVDDIMRSSETIEIVSWAKLQEREREEQARRMYAAFKSRMKDRTHPIALRRLLWRREHLEWLRGVRAEYDKLGKAEIRYYAPLVGDEVPIVPCLLKDGVKVHFGLGYLGTPGLGEVDIVSTNAATTEAFDQYFSYLWGKSRVLKAEGGTIDTVVLRSIEQSL